MNEDVIIALQRFSSPTLDYLFGFFSFLGSEIFYLFFLSFIYFCLEKKMAVRLGIVIFLSMYINFSLKEFFHFPRPQSPSLRILEKPEGESFPSGHAQSVATVSFFLARAHPKIGYYLLAITVSLMVSLSRVYLGVHFPRDVIVGAGLGFLIAHLCWFIFYRVKWKENTKSPVWLFLLSLLFGGILYLLSRDSLSARVAGTLSGILCGAILEKSLIKFVIPSTITVRLLRYGLGMAIIIALYFFMKSVFPDSLFGYFSRYYILNFSIIFVIPFLLYKNSGSKFFKKFHNGKKCGQR